MVFEKIREIIANKLDIDVVTITPETSFDDITIDQADGMEKVADIVAYVENKLQK
ncbi:MAG: hypothetical protein RR387_00345 [Clostridiales bacterium]